MSITATFRRLAGRPLWLLWGYLLLISIAELVTALISAQLGMFLHALLLVGFIVRGAMARFGAEQRLALALTLAPLIRLLSLALPLIMFPQLAWYPIVSLPLMVAAWIVIRQLRLSSADLGLRTGNLALQLMLAAGGLALGVIEYRLLAPKPLISTFTWNSFFLASLILVLSTGFAEELIFRGVLQSLALPALGLWGLVYVSLLFAILHVGYRSVGHVAAVFAAGMIFAAIAYWSGSILGLSLAHGLTNVMLFLVLPWLSQQAPASVVALMPWVIAAGTAIALLALIILIRDALLRSAARAGLPGTGVREVVRFQLQSIAHRRSLGQPDSLLPMLVSTVLGHVQRAVAEARARVPAAESRASRWVWFVGMRHLLAIGAVRGRKLFTAHLLAGSRRRPLSPALATTPRLSVAPSPRELAPQPDKHSQETHRAKPAEPDQREAQAQESPQATDRVIERVGAKHDASIQEDDCMSNKTTEQFDLADAEAPDPVTATEIEHEITRIGERYVEDLRALSEQLSRYYDAQLAAKDTQITDLSLRLQSVERERDALAQHIRELKGAGAKHIAQLRALSEELSRNISNGESGALDTTHQREGP